MKNKMNKYEVTILYTTIAYEKKIDTSQIISNLELNHSATELEGINFL